jgi:hypothetical protein
VRSFGASRCPLLTRHVYSPLPQHVHNAFFDKQEAVVPYSCRREWTVQELVMIGGLLLNIALKGSIACFETLGAEYAMVRYNLNSVQTGYTFACFGACGVVALMSFRILCHYVNDVQLVLGGMLIMSASCALLVNVEVSDRSSHAREHQRALPLAGPNFVSSVFDICGAYVRHRLSHWAHCGTSWRVCVPYLTLTVVTGTGDVLQGCWRRPTRRVSGLVWVCRLSCPRLFSAARWVCHARK